MKYLIIFLMIFSFIVFGYSLKEDTKKYRINGVLKVKIDPSLRPCREDYIGSYFFIYYSDSLKKNVFIKVDQDVFYNNDIGKKVSFNLDRDMFDNNYINTSFIFLILFLFILFSGIIYLTLNK